MNYTLDLRETASSTGYFAPMPSGDLSIEEGLSHVRVCPLDTFMRGYLLNRLREISPHELEEILDVEKSDAVRALLYEAVLLHDGLGHLRHRFEPSQVQALASHAPLLYIRSSLLSDQPLHGKWIRLFRANIQKLKPLPKPGETGLAPPIPREALADLLDETPAVFLRPAAPSAIPTPQSPPEETARRVLDLLFRRDILEGSEMRHVASLSPLALLQKWRLRTTVRSGRHAYALSGIQTAYGRGFDAWSARIGYAMEIVERMSAFGDVENRVLQGIETSHVLRYGSWESLAREGISALDPNRLRLEVPYMGEPFYWMAGETVSDGVSRAVWVPVQTVFLFSNLDEINLFSGFGSTGLAAGLTQAQARLGALLECVERDADAVTPFDPSRCFRVVADDPEISALLRDYRERGIHVGCQEITTEIGIPAFRCMVMGMNGQVVRGTAAHLNARRALLSALTETPYPYPYGPPSLPMADAFPIRQFETIPNFETGNAASDLVLAESLLSARGYQPIHVDITRRDLSIPVVRTLVPGLEVVNDFDFLSRVSPRLFANYLKMVEGPGTRSFIAFPWQKSRERQR